MIHDKYLSTPRTTSEHIKRQILEASGEQLLNAHNNNFAGTALAPALKQPQRSSEPLHCSVRMGPRRSMYSGMLNMACLFVSISKYLSWHDVARWEPEGCVRMSLRGDQQSASTIVYETGGYSLSWSARIHWPVIARNEISARATRRFGVHDECLTRM